MQRVTLTQPPDLGARVSVPPIPLEFDPIALSGRNVTDDEFDDPSLASLDGPDEQQSSGSLSIRKTARERPTARPESRKIPAAERAAHNPSQRCSNKGKDRSSLFRGSANKRRRLQVRDDGAVDEALAQIRKEWFDARSRSFTSQPYLHTSAN